MTVNFKKFPEAPELKLATIANNARLCVPRTCVIMYYQNAKKLPLKIAKSFVDNFFSKRGFVVNKNTYDLTSLR